MSKRAGIFIKRTAAVRATPQAIASWPEPAKEVARFLDTAEDTAVRVYRANRLPTSPGSYWRAGQNGPWLPVTAITPRGTKQHRWPFIADEHPADSAVGYARAVLTQCVMLRAALASRRLSAEDAMQRTIVLHRNLLALTFEFGFGNALGRGVKVGSAARAGGKAKAAQNTEARERHRLWQLEAERYWRDHPGESVSRVATHVAKRFSARSETVRKAIKRL